MNIETHRSYTFATLLDPRYKCAGFHCREKAQAAKELLISVVEERLHQERSGRVARSGLNDSENQGDITDESVVSVLDTDEDITWTQLLRGAADDRPESPNNAVRDEVARYLREKLVSQRLDPLIYWKRNHKTFPNLSKLVRVYLCPPPSSVASERAFKVAKNVVGDRRLSMRPENLEMNMFLKYNLRALNYSVESLQSVPETFGCPNSQKRDPRDSDEGSEDDSTDGEDSDIDLGHDSDDGDD